MANTIVERGRCFHAVVNDSVCESGSDLFLMRSTIVSSGFHPGSLFNSFSEDISAINATL